MTPGQAAREAFGELGADWYPGTPWNGLHEDLRAQWDAAAEAVAAPLREEIASLRARLAEAEGERDLPGGWRDRLRDMTGQRDEARAEAASLRQDAFDAAKIADRYRAALEAIAEGRTGTGAVQCAREALGTYGGGGDG